MTHTKQTIPSKRDWSIERGNYGLSIATIFRGYRVHQNYIGYPKREALKLFRAHLKSL